MIWILLLVWFGFCALAAFGRAELKKQSQLQTKMQTQAEAKSTRQIHLN